MHPRILINRVRRILTPSKKLFFLHIAKCGGISINRALRYRYLGGYERLNARASLDAAVDLYCLKNAFDDDYESVLRLRENLLLYFLHEGHSFVSGHYAFSEAAHRRFQNEYVFMTILRNPVDRFLSSYFFNLKKAESSPWRINESLDDYINTKQARNLGNDFVRLLGGVRNDRNYRSEKAIEQALENVKLFDVVGIIEQPQNIKDSIRSVLNLRINVGHKNKNPISTRRRCDLVSEEMRARISEICEPDLRVYNATVKLLREVDS